MKPLILMSNDDGIDSSLLQALADALDASADIDADLLVVAPERQRSAASHAITLHKPLRLRDHGQNRYSLSGTPVDCVYVGVHQLAPRPPALVISGINLGFNLGSDVFYSGTVAAAVEGSLRGARSLALSLSPSPDREGTPALAFCLALIKKVLEPDFPLSAPTVLNVNLPTRSSDAFAWTVLGQRVWEDDVHERVDPRGRPYYWIGGGLARMGTEPGTDTDAITRGIISVTPLNLQRTDKLALHRCATTDVPGYRRV